MSLKKSLPFFAFQVLKYAKNTAQGRKLWAYRRRWAESFEPGKNSMADEQAWITFAALDFLDAHLKPDHRVFEYGGGGSSLFFLKRAGLVVTVEHHEGWFKVLQEKIHKKGFLHWQGRFIPGLPDARYYDTTLSELDAFRSRDKPSEGLSYEAYAKSIHDYPDEWFDWVLVDGRARPSCIREAVRHIRRGGRLVVDNTERAYYLEPFENQFKSEFKTILHSFSPSPYYPEFCRTTILQKI